MELNWIGYYPNYDGYGRFNAHFATALQRAGVEVNGYHVGQLEMPPWMLEQQGFDWSRLTISCVPPYMLGRIPGRHWLFSMTEGSKIPKDWVAKIEAAGVERVLVPCRHNEEAFEASGVSVPVHVAPGGTDPDEFPLLTAKRPVMRPYTFLAFADRGFRKGWNEVYKAFYIAFGGKTTGKQDVRLIIKCRPGGNEHIEVTQRIGITGADPRVTYMVDDVTSLRDLFAQVDCFAIPSRTEGWGMPHREAAMMGLSVITQAHSGLDDGHTHEWAIVLENGRMQQIDDEGKHIAGEWMVADVDELAHFMRACYDEPEAYRRRARYAREWLKGNQTWSHAASKMISLIEEVDSGLQMGRTAGRRISANGEQLHAGYLPERAASCL